MICIKQGNRVGTIECCWRCFHVSLGRASLDFHSSSLLLFGFEFCSVGLEPNLRDHGMYLQL